MKRLSFRLGIVCFLAVFALAPAFAGDSEWKWMNPQPQGNSHDGTGWSAMTSGTTRHLWGVWGSSATDVFAVGDSGAILRFNGTSWSTMTSGTTRHLWGVWGSSATDVFAVGSSGTILHYDGTNWSAMTSDTKELLNDVWGSSATDVFAVGSYGTILHYDGTGWSAMTSGTTRHLCDVWGSSATDVFAVGTERIYVDELWSYFVDIILHYDGMGWSEILSRTGGHLYGIWGSSATNVFAVGGSDPILHYDGTSWSTMTSGTTELLYGVWGSSATDVFAVGGNGTILHYDGTSWSAMESGTMRGLTEVWGSLATDVFAVGISGTILHYDGGTIPTVTTNAATGITSNSATLNMSYTMGSYGSVNVRFAHKKSSDAAWTHTDWTTKSAPGDYAWEIAGLDSDTLYDFKAQLAYNSVVLSGDTLQFTTSGVITPPAIGLNRTSLNFGVTAGGAPTQAQKVIISNTGGGTLDWTAAGGAGWLGVTPAAGSGTGTVTVSVDATGLAAGTYTSQVAFTAPGASNSPQSVDVVLKVYPQGSSTAPFGVFDTPANGATVYGAIPVTGWALDDIEVRKVEVKRSPHATDPAGVIGSDGLIFISDAIFIDGARPDVEAAFPQHPLQYRAGWGYMLLTNMLPNQGNDVFTLHAFAVDKEGTRVKLGQKTITGNNAGSAKPFGTIDAPAQGEQIGGEAFNNFGWALTPQPNMIPTDGSTLRVWVDGASLGHPAYNYYRPSLAALFPGLANTSGPVGLYVLNTTAFANGVHTIAWSAVDSGGNAEGLGSRFFSVLNLGGAEIEGTGSGVDRTMGSQDGLRHEGSPGGRALIDRSVLDGIAANVASPVYMTKGYDMNARPDILHPNSTGTVNIEIVEVERVELAFGAEAIERGVWSGRFSGRGAGAQPHSSAYAQQDKLTDRGYKSIDRGFGSGVQPPMSAYAQPDGSMGRGYESMDRGFGPAALSGFLVVGDELRPLPIGSMLDPATGVFAWQPGPGFLGEYTFVFVREHAGGLRDKTFVRITIAPKF